MEYKKQNKINKPNSPGRYREHSGSQGEGAGRRVKWVIGTQEYGERSKLDI